MKSKFFLAAIMLLCFAHLNAQQSIAQNEIACAGCNGIGTIAVETTCKLCSGNGAIACTACSGNGRLTCKDCSGSGQGVISPTKGIYSAKCPACGGVGSIQCKVCAGKKSFVCSECHGAKVISTNEACKICNGKGKISDSLQLNGEMPVQTEIFYNLKVNNLDVGNATFLNHYLESYDKSYRSYAANEFEMNKKMNELKRTISASLPALRFTDIYTAKLEVKFGEYDFSKNAFKFQPFAKEFMGNPEGAINKINYFFNHAGFSQMHYSSSFITASNISDFDGLVLDPDAAQELLKYKTKGGSIDRHVAIKLFYSMMNSVFKDYAGQNDGIYCYVYRMEVWGDKCATEKLVSVIYAKEPPPQYLESTKDNFARLYPHGAVATDSYKGVAESDNFKSIITWSQYNENCEREEFDLHLKKAKTKTEQEYLLIRLFTNFNYNIKPGFVFSFYNTAKNKEFPLTVSETSVERGAALLKVKVTRQALNEIMSSDCSSFRLQLNGSPKYTMPGEGVYRSLNVVTRHIDMANYHLGTDGKTVLFSILRQ
jgi:hypothetical protein